MTGLTPKNWKKRLYDSYVSTGQAASHLKDKQSLQFEDYLNFKHLVNQFVSSDRDIKIVDLGCGHGALVYYLQSLGYRYVHGVDFSPEQVRLAHQLGIKDVTCSVIDDYLHGKKQEFDLIFLLDVLEHLTRQELFIYLDLVFAALKTGGKVIFRVPNGEGLFGMRIRYGDLTHELCFTPRSVKQMLRAVGFKFIEVREISPIVHGAMSFIRWIIWNVMTVYPKILLMAETGTMDHILSQNMWVVARK